MLYSIHHIYPEFLTWYVETGSFFFMKSKKRSKVGSGGVLDASPPTPRKSLHTEVVVLIVYCYT